MTTETDALIKPANVREQLLGKVSKMRQNVLMARQREEIKFQRCRLVEGFREFAERYFWIDLKQILELSDPEIEALFFLVYKRARKRAFCVKILAYGTFIGWLSGGLMESKLIRFANSVSKLKKLLGNDFDPVCILRGYYP